MSAAYEFVSELPRRWGSDWHTWLQPLKARPGVWARVVAPGTRPANVANYLNRGGYGLKGEWEAAVRHGELYVRYKGVK